MLHSMTCLDRTVCAKMPPHAGLAVGEDPQGVSFTIQPNLCEFKEAGAHVGGRVDVRVQAGTCIFWTKGQGGLNTGMVVCVPAHGSGHYALFSPKPPRAGQVSQGVQLRTGHFKRAARGNRLSCICELASTHLLNTFTRVRSWLSKTQQRTLTELSYGSDKDFFFFLNFNPLGTIDFRDHWLFKKEQKNQAHTSPNFSFF